MSFSPKYTGGSWLKKSHKSDKKFPRHVEFTEMLMQKGDIRSYLNLQFVFPFIKYLPLFVLVLQYIVGLCVFWCKVF